MSPSRFSSPSELWRYALCILCPVTRLIVQIMDPKMDSGVTLPDQDAIMDEFDPLKSLPPEEVLGIMDQLLCYEMTWHEGYPLSQTLFTSLHLDRLLPIERQPLHQIRFDKRNSPNGDDILITKVLRAYCLGLAKCCQSVIENIAKERYHEEEDFVSQTFDKYLLSDVDEDSIEAELKNAIDALSKLGLANNIVDAFRTRLWLRLFLVQAFQPDDPAESHTIKMEIWAKAHSFLYVLNDRDISYGIPVPLAFSERVQRYLASNTPPRPMIQTSWTEIYPKWRQMCEDNMEAYRLVASLYYQDSLGISPHSLMVNASLSCWRVRDLLTPISALSGTLRPESHNHLRTRVRSCKVYSFDTMPSSSWYRIKTCCILI